MEGHLDIFTEQMFDVYQSYQNKNNHELMDYISKTNDSFVPENTMVLNSGLVQNYTFNYNNNNNNTESVLADDNGIMSDFSNDKLFQQDEELFNFAGFNNINMNNNIQQMYANYNSDDSDSTLHNQPEMLSPQSSDRLSVDISSIFSYDMNPETISEPSLAATRTNSMSSLSSVASTSVKTPNDYSNLVKMQQIKKSPYSSISLSSGNVGALKSSSLSQEAMKSAKTSGKRHSDSRLSLNELSNFLSLRNDLAETAKREQQILTIFKDELGFELGLKTWVRDTSSSKRQQLVDDLTLIVESRYHYGYTEKTIEVIIRRASYYTMQGRLRRERRIEQKIKGDRFDKGNRRNKRS